MKCAARSVLGRRTASINDEPAGYPSGMTTSAATIKRTPLYDWHVARGARMVEYAGWEMPVIYTGIPAEHNQCRTSGALFDVSHMGRLRFVGADAKRFLAHVCTRDASKLTPGQSRYGFVCQEDGGILDDVIIACPPEADHMRMVCNASNRAKLLEHFEKVKQAMHADVTIEDHTEATAMIALQGPKVMHYVHEKLTEAAGMDVGTLKKFGWVEGTWDGKPIGIYRSGYTGEDGVELVVPAEFATEVADWACEDGTIAPAVLGARDTLRVEAALPLYGHELDDTVTPFHVGMSWAVNAGRTFVGATALENVRDIGPDKVLVGLELDGRRTARQGQAVVVDDLEVGQVTSGVYGPTVGKSVAMAFVTADYSGVMTPLGVDFKRETVQAKVVPLPFYKRAQ